METSLSRRAWMTGAVALSQSAAQPVRLPQKVQLALIGLEGHTGEILNPLPGLRDVELVAFADADPQARLPREFRDQSIRRYTDYRKLLETEKLDMVAVCGSNDLRAAAIVACAERRLHVVAEKPLGVEMAEVKRVEDAVKKHGIRLSMLLPMRFAQPYLAMREMVASGAIGEVALISAQKSYKLGERAEWMRHRKTFGGTIPYIGIHMVDLMRMIGGREFTATAAFQGHVGDAAMRGMENTTATIFRLDNGGTGILNMDYLRPETAPTHGDDRLRFAGTEGVLEHQMATGLTLVTQKEKHRVISGLPPSRSLFVDFLESVYLGHRGFLDIADIFRVNRIVFAARDAADRGVVVKLV